MLIKEDFLKHWIDNFYGYGQWSARHWFIALEETGGDAPEEVAEKLEYFHNTHSQHDPHGVLCDIRDMYKHVKFRDEGPKANLYDTLYDFRFGPQATPNGFWKNLTSFSFGYKGQEVADTLVYQQKSLTAKGNEALIKLYPLPAHNHAWYYSWLDMPGCPFLKTRSAYEEHLFERRMKVILDNIASKKPDLVIMYGMKDINSLKQCFSSNFREVSFSSVKATKLVIPQHHYTTIGKTVVAITTQVPGLRHGRIETGFDWYQFGRSLRQRIESVI